MRLASLLVLASLFFGVKARAQCAPNDAMSPARRARHVVDGAAQADRVVDEDEGRVEALESDHRELAPKDPVRVYGALVVAGLGFEKMPVCTTVGSVKGTFSQTQVGLLAAARHDPTGLELRLQAHHVGDSIHSRETPRGEASFYATQSALGGSLGFRRWARLEMLAIVPLDTGATTDGEGTAIVRPPGSDRSHLAMGIGVPALRLATHGLVDASRGTVETARFGVDQLPLADTPFEATAAVLVIRDEDQSAGLLGLTWVLDEGMDASRVAEKPGEQILDGWGRTTLSGEASVERPRLRHAELRFDSLAGTRAVYGDLLSHMSAGVHGAVTYYGSEYSLRQTASSAGVFGANAGIFTQVSSRYASLQFDMSGGVNRPATLARLSSARNVGEFQGMLYLKIGYGRRFRSKA